MNVEVRMFSSTTCGPCSVMKPRLVDACDDRGLWLTITHITKDSPEIAQYEIRGVPTTLFMKDGEVAFKVVGAMSSQEIDEALIRLVDTPTSEKNAS